jgi:peroxiredoxin
MKILTTCFIYFIAISTFSYAQNSKNNSPKIEPKILLKDFQHWWNYTYKFVNLSSDFKAYSSESKVISKESFLKSLSTGNYIPLMINSNETQELYKLYKLKSSDNADIISAMKQLGQTEYERFKREGTKIPKFNFKDLNGKIYTNENTKGKTLVLKCWFIHCTSCVAEMPDLNQLVAKYKNRKDVLFVSLAYDSETQLKEFLHKKVFDYAVVSIKQNYIEKQLNVSAYPTHFIINKDGIIAKIVDRQDYLAEALKKELGQ